MKAVMLGSGKVATAMGLQLAKHIQFVEVFSPNTTHAKTLANKLNSVACSEIEKLTLQADVYILAVKDDALAQLAQQLRLNNKLVIHTSGSAEIDVLSPISSQIGVMYPLQSIAHNFNLNKWKSARICIEASTKEALSTVETLAHFLSTKIHPISSKQRLNLHLAAVFANNFVNHMLYISQNILQENLVNPEMLHTLIRETTENAILFGAKESQTGPAIRHDQKTIEKHIELLNNKDLEKEIYTLLTQSIQQKFNHE